MDNKSFERSHYLWQRKVLGILMMALPIVSALLTYFDPSNPDLCRWSISDTFYTNSRVVFIAIVSIIGFFFCTYRPYNRWVDNLANWMTGICCFLILIFPTKPRYEVIDVTNLFMIDPSVTVYLHYPLAALIFVGLLINLLFCFTRSDGNSTPKKLLRNKIYYATAVCIVVASVFLVIAIVKAKTLGWFVEVAECIVLIPAGIAWLTKSEAFTFLND